MKQRKTTWVWLPAAVLACSGPPGIKGDTGNPGDTGPAGLSALVAIAPEGAGSNCSLGGVAVRGGLDVNRNNVLDGPEVTSTSYACNGSADTPQEVLTKLNQVDSNTSDLNAQYLQGQQPADLKVPVGSVVAFAGATPPAGWLLCDGQVVARNTYGDLHAVIGYIHGGSGNNFNLPDYRGRFLRGVDGTAGRDPDRTTRAMPAGGGNSGNNVGSVQGPATARPGTAFTTDNPGNHSHTNGNFTLLLQASGGAPTTAINGDATASEPDIFNSDQLLASGAHAHSITGGGDSETRPHNAYVNYIIKY